MGFLAGLIGGGDGAQQPAMAQPVDPLAPLPEQQAARPHKAFRDTGFANVLGMLGDALLVRGGHAPMYAPMKAQRQEQQRQDQANQAIGNYLGNLDPALRELITQAGPGAGMQAYKIAHPDAGLPPETIRLMQAAGIDPQSEEGKAIIQQHLQGGGGNSSSTFERELNALGIDPHSDEARELYYGRNSPSGFLLKPPPRQMGNPPSFGGPPVGHVQGGFRFKGGNPNDRNSWEPVSGGPTPQASGPFPARRD